MKILSGFLRGRHFYMPYGIRPTLDVIRKSLFDTLGQDMDGVSFLDLFGGSGSVGLEAMSRGAQSVVWVEKDPKCVKVIEENLVSLAPVHLDKRVTSFDVIRSDAFAAIKAFTRQGKKFHVVFVDPPYSRELAKKALKTLYAHDILHPNSFVIFQHDKREVLPEAHGTLSLFKQKKYGTSLLTFYQGTS